MRINQTFEVLNRTLSTSIRRQYPLVYNDKLTYSYDKLTLPKYLENSLAKIPYIEALPQYRNNPKGYYDSGLQALLDPEALGEKYQDLIEFMNKWKSSGVFFDPYVHQVQALKAWAKGSDIVVSTGTGSGKTECFLWPIVGHLHDYARRNQDNPDEHRGIKALILYPMNALVTDQLKRLRQLLGGEDLAKDLAQGALIQGGINRPFQFGQYTGRTKFHGSYAKSGGSGGSVNAKVPKAVKQFDNFNKIREHKSTRPENDGSLYSQMMDKGLIPAKGSDENLGEGSFFWDMRPFSSHQGAHDKPNAKLITEPGDRELFFRHEMHNSGYANLTMRQGGDRIPRITKKTNGGGTPDVLVTNYSMLEYMLKRPLEHGMFHETKEWLTKHPDNKLMLVLDEAHLYQGALGSEVGLLVRRLLSSLGILGADNREKVQFILTSASLGDDPASKERFVNGLTGRPLEETGNWKYSDSGDIDWNSDLSTSSIFISGDKWSPKEGDCTDEDLQEIRNELLSLNYKNKDKNYLVNYFLEKDYTPSSAEELTKWLRKQPLFRRLYVSLLDCALSLDEVGHRLFGTTPGDSESKIKRARIATEAVLNLVAALKGPRPDSERILPLLGIRAHLLYRGLPRIYWDLKQSRILLREQNSLDVAYPVRGCRQCGAPYASVWISQGSWAQVSDTIQHGGACTARTFSRPIDHSIRLEVYIYDDYITVNDKEIGYVKIGEREIFADGTPHIWVNTEDYEIKVNETRPGVNWKIGHIAAEKRTEPTDSISIIQNAIRNSQDDSGRSNVQEITFCKASCLQCNTSHHRRKSDQITDYMTRGDDAFSQLMKELISYQSEDPKKDHLPNKGKKVMVFSDSRSRAAKLAKKIQDNSNYDELRLLLLHLLNQPWYKALPNRIKTLEFLYSTFVLNCIRAKLEPFSGTGDKYRNSRNSFARSRVDVIAAHAALLHDKVDHAFFENRRKLKQIIESASGEVSLEDKAKSFYSDFCDRAPRTNDEFIDARQRNRKNSHPAYVKFIRRELMSAVTRGVKNLTTEMAFSSNEKHIILGVFFDPEFHNENNEIDPSLSKYEDMNKRLTELGITFTDESVENNSITRFQNIMLTINSGIDKLKPKRFDIEKWRTLARDIRNLSKMRVKKIRDFQVNNQAASYQNCRIHINSRNYTLNQLSEIAEDIIDAIQELLTGTRRRSHWEDVSNLANLSNSTPWDFSSAILDFIGSKDFSLSSLGLGYASLSPIVKWQLSVKFAEDSEDPGESIQEFNNHWDKHLYSVLDELVHWMSRPSFGPDSDDGKEKSGGQRCIYSNSVYNYQTMKHHPSVYTNEEEWGILANRVETKYEALISAIGTDILVPFADVRSCLFENNSHIDAGEKLLVKAQVVELKCLLDDDSKLLGCTRCGITMPVLNVKTAPKECINCRFDELIEYNRENPIFSQRIQSPWREPAIKAINSSYENLEITVIRAEEHTAQINTAKDEEEMYTSAEEFELLFQDIPFTVPEEDDAWTFVQSPIDILSCTTTMEVGIDIGSLTCVALRTIPRKASNYQQRVGRAGRGSAEVCVAVSWCDNQPHAQNYFDNPREMLTHPKDSPVIYLNNLAIIERHINAAIFQAFFKRMKYNLRDRRFEGMGAPEHEANLMESMGTLEGFFSDSDDNGFSYINFKNWIKEIEPLQEENPEMVWSNISSQIEAILPEGLEKDLQYFVTKLLNFLKKIDKQKQQNREGEE